MVLRTLKFDSPLPPSTNSYLGTRVVYIKNYGNKVVFYKTGATKEYEKHMDAVLKRAIKEQNWENDIKKENYVVCRATVYMNKKHRDIDNLFKCLFDSITRAGVIKDDSYLIPVVDNLFIDSKNPRVEVSLELLDKVGVFENRASMKEFLSENCDKCTKNPNACTMFKKSLENRIIDEIDLENNICLKRKEKK